MGFLSNAITGTGLLFLIHACYSAYEHSSTQKGSETSLPLDITIESILSVLIACVGLVLGSSPLKPIAWRVWAGKIEREGGRGEEGHPFIGLESRLGFMDIRAKRREFAEWVTEQNSKPVQ